MTPDKIYVKRNIFGEMTGYEEDWCHPPHCVEYVRKDTFINKACEWLDKNLYDFYDGEDEFGKCTQGRTAHEFIKDFKNYMEE